MVTILDTRADGERPSRPRHPEKAHRPDQPMPAKPAWIRVRAPGSEGYLATRAIVRAHGLATVCEEAGCPNIGTCWEKRHATMMIMGDVCTRACAFCNVATGRAASARCGRAAARRGCRGGARARACRDHLRRPRRSRRRRSRAFCGGHPEHPCVVARDEHRGADPGFPAQGRRARAGDRGAGRMCSTTTSKRCRGSMCAFGPGRAISIRCGSCSARRKSIRRSSRSPV